jgi:hypothetical protein
MLKLAINLVKENLKIFLSEYKTVLHFLIHPENLEIF